MHKGLLQWLLLLRNVFTTINDICIYYNDGITTYLIYMISYYIACGNGLNL